MSEIHPRFVKSDIDPNFVRPMEVHLTRIGKGVIKLDDEENIRNTQHFIKICETLPEKMEENNEIFKKIYRRVVPAGSYPDHLKISEPNEYDALIVLNFPGPCVVPSRPGYVTINIQEAIQDGWNIGKDNYELFVDGKGYLIQNKVLNWFRCVVRNTLQEHNNVIVSGENWYEITQSSNGPAVTLTVTVQNDEDSEFCIDFVSCLEFHSDEWWASDVRGISGNWNAIPKPIKLNNYIRFKLLVPGLQDVIESYERQHAMDSGDRKSKAKKSNVCEKVISDVKFTTNGKAKIPAKGVLYKKPKEFNMSRKANAPTGGMWYRKPKKPKVNEVVVMTAFEKKRKNIAEKVALPSSGVRWEQSKTSSVNGKAKIPAKGIYYKRPKYPKLKDEADLSNAGVPSGVGCEISKTSTKIPTKGMCYRKLRKPNMKDESVISAEGAPGKKQRISNVSDKQQKIPAKGIYYKRPKYPKLKDEADLLNAGVLRKSGVGCENSKTSNINGKTKIPVKGMRYRKLRKPNIKDESVMSAEGVPGKKQRTSNVTGKQQKSQNFQIPNPNENREWICSYAGMERELLKGKDKMKPLIRIFKKIRDNKQLSNLKSFYIKTIFLHQHIRTTVIEYWQQSLAVLFMEMIDVILEHLYQHRLESFWHTNFNLFQHLTSNQIKAIYETLHKIKNDINSNLADDNPEFVYEVVCTESERSDLLMDDSI